MIITLDLQADRPIYHQIADGVRRALTEGTIAPGDRLPPGRELAESLDVNLETVQRAYRQLAGEGIVTSRVGRGTRISETANVDTVGIQATIDDLVAQATRVGLTVDEVVDRVRSGFAT